MNPISIRLLDNINQTLTMKPFSVSELVSGSDDTPVLMSPCCQLSVPKKLAKFSLKSVLKGSDDGMLTAPSTTRFMHIYRYFL